MTSRYYADLGKLVCVEHPELVEKLTQQITEANPKLIDLSLLPGIFQKFCSLKGLTKSDLCGIEINRNITHNRQLFLAVVVRIYSPRSLGFEPVRLVKNLRRDLSIILEAKGERISLIISNVRVFLKAYKDFALEVDHYYTKVLEAIENEQKEN